MMRCAEGKGVGYYPLDGGKNWTQMECPQAGKCVIMVSSELPEILAMSDHVVVMRGGRVMADIDRDTPHFNSEDIMKAAWGGELD